METRKCQNCKEKFVIDKEDFNFYEKINVPPPTFCPDCRSQRRLAWQNDITLHHSACALCGKPVVTIYSKESGMLIYCVKCWWSDKWDPFKYGRDYDFSRPFFEQMEELARKVPHMALINDDGVASLNCEYTQNLAFAKNCYMTFVAWFVENILYSYFMLSGKDMMDCLNIRSKNEWLYECMIARDCYNLKYSRFCLANMDCQFVDHCSQSSDCFMCYGLVRKKYHFKNKQYSEKEYKKILGSYRLDTYSGVEKAKKEFKGFLTPYFRRYAEMFHSVNSTGDIISHSKNVKSCFVEKDSENCKYEEFTAGNKECYDISNGGKMSECYETITGDMSSRNLFGILSWKSQDLEYTRHCHSSKSLFGCVALRNKKYCILNKQYSKEEYKKLTEKIRKQMNEMPYRDRMGNSYGYGEFYPAELSYFGYNETAAAERFPLGREEAVKKGFKWQDNFERTTGKETLRPEEIPDSINDVEYSILDEILKCAECGRNYKIVPNELLFYRKMKIPVARKCFYCRHADRVRQMNPFKLWHRKCMCKQDNHFHRAGDCGVEFETTYAPDRPEIIYCEKCYQSEIF